MRTWRYHQLVGKTVVAADGKIVGRVADLAAERQGDALVVTELLVGPTALVQRIGFRWLARLGGQAPRRVAWACVARIDDRVHLSVPLARLDAWQAAAFEGEAAEAG